MLFLHILEICLDSLELLWESIFSANGELSPGCKSGKFGAISVIITNIA